MEQSKAIEVNKPAAVYAHVPFCRAKCAYCDFNSYAGREGLHEPYVRAICAEAERYWRGVSSLERCLASGDDAVIRTVYLGGGTPTVLDIEQLGRILAACAPACLRSEDAELTVEVNPGTIDRDRLVALRYLGVNRLSLGVQSLDDSVLRFLGRIHSADQARQAMSMCRQAGFDNVNLDFIYGLPDQTLEDWRQTLDSAVQLAPEHLSLYSLTVEPGTVLYQWMERGQVVLPDEDSVADMYTLAEEVLDAAGYEHYEISNWARPGKPCRHNLVYWANEPYIGFGAGAHSYLAGCRRQNVAEPGVYAVRQAQGTDALGAEEAIDRDLEMAETMFLGLRRSGGVSRHEFHRRFGSDLNEHYGSVIDELCGLGLLTKDGDWVRLTRRGRLLGNEVFVRFLPSSGSRPREV